MTEDEQAELRRKATIDALEFAEHAYGRMAQRRISAGEVRQALISGRVLEYYPDDRHGPSCLVLGRTAGNRPLHVVCSHPRRPRVKVITACEPDLGQWHPDFINRRTP